MAALLYASRRADCPYEIVLVTGDNPAAPGLDLAEGEGVSVVRLDKPKKGEKAAFFDRLSQTAQAAGADIIALAGFMRILPESFVSAWEDAIINIHPSLLPKYKGLHTHARALEEGDEVAGCTVHVVTPELDSGAILGRSEVAIIPGDTPGTLAARVLIAEHQLYARALEAYITRSDFAARPKPLPKTHDQGHGQAG